MQHGFIHFHWLPSLGTGTCQGGTDTRAPRSPASLAASLDEEGRAEWLSYHNPCAAPSRRRSAAPRSWAAGPGRSCLCAEDPGAERCSCRRSTSGLGGESRRVCWALQPRRGSSSGQNGPGSYTPRCTPTSLTEKRNTSPWLLRLHRRSGGQGG